ncbi:Protein trichome birefringence-like 36 [Asimina triloba]
MATYTSQPFGFLCFLCFLIFISSHGFFFYVGLAQSDVGSFDQESIGEDDDVSMVGSSQQRYERRCDLSVGRWVYDESYPLYKTSCPYLSGKVSCEKNGRPDSDYQKWRWQPRGCKLRRFDALGFLAKMRKKRIMLVGDSIMRNQWESLVCLVESVIPPQMKTVTYNGPTMAFQASDFQISIEFAWAPFLVEMKVGPRNKRILELDSIEENARHWRGVDMLVFDSAHWWTHSGEGSSWDYFMEGKRPFTNLNPMVAYEKGLQTWSRWVDLNLNPQKTKVIFRSVSPRHNRQNGLKCYNQKEPLMYFRHQPHLPEQLSILKRVLTWTRFPVQLQDITLMSALRRDGHPSVYSKVISEAERARPQANAPDCSHWCLPGVPDTWNEMLYALI